ncbi:hypothetical protein BU26DRAFT_520588 [Trematosphaeria pertusa]|uniref:Uncharacterized protein n=1 Tax=Trematosphaeria pertusa TaxID=390896 RepID=A0A6A6IB29_9PLEO|nr:uncharacterized protein BU26DRAFT_520588 [Trematosphaeria pertusa]KAF2247417.1 hypothetical protein BU26DRAFT_520588 [Trematosphaeria pertusa]
MSRSHAELNGGGFPAIMGPLIGVESGHACASVNASLWHVPHSDGSPAFCPAEWNVSPDRYADMRHFPAHVER